MPKREKRSPVIGRKSLCKRGEVHATLNPNKKGKAAMIEKGSKRACVVIGRTICWMLVR